MSDKPTPNFPGVLRPSVDFGPILTELRTTPLQLTVDLSTARSGATALILPITGNVLYIDNRPGTGTAELVLIDDTMTPGPARITVGPGYVLRAPFRAVAVENSAQAGQSLRIIYGVDIEFAPGQAANVSLSGTADVRIASVGSTATAGILGAAQSASLPVHQAAMLGFQAHSTSTNPLAAGATDQVISPASNTGGCIIRRAHFVSLVSTGTDARQMTLLGKTSAPTSLSDGICFLMAQSFSGNVVVSGFTEEEFRIPAGMGLYWYAVQAETQAIRSVVWTFQ